jgi:ArsR family transcriptional regulator
MPSTTSISLPVIDETDAAVETLKFLSDGNRLRILKILSRRESCVCELIEQIGLTQPLVSYHLRRLRDAGLVRTRRKAQWVYYSIDPTAWRSLIAPLRNGYLVTEFPPEAAYGASDSCDTKIPDPALGASQPNGIAWSED